MEPLKVLVDSAHHRCELNAVHSAMIQRYLTENGHQVTSDEHEADVIIINTCGYHEVLRDVSIALYEKYHTRNPDKKILLYGCLVNIKDDRLQNIAADLVGFSDDALFDSLFMRTTPFQRFTPYCDRSRSTPCETPQLLPIPNSFLTRLLLPWSKTMKADYDHLMSARDYQNKMVVQISTGCLGNCHYCAIKKAKGALKSRPIDAILADIRKMDNPSAPLYLVADDCSCYGLDIGTDLFHLISRIHEAFPTLSIQISYISPNLLLSNQEKYEALLADSPITYVTIPLQSGSQNILAAMNRHYDPKEVIVAVKKLRRISPDILIEGHFIVGYPGETLLDFLKSLALSRYFDFPLSFSYSETKDVKSASLPGKKSEATKDIRNLVMTVAANGIVAYRLLKRGSRKNGTAQE